MSRQSSRGNPYHYPAGTPRGGQFAPKGYAEAAAVVCGQYFADRSAFEAYEQSGKLEKDSKKYYNEDRTKERFLNGEATEAQMAFAEKIEKSLGVPAPVNGTARDYEDYIKENIYDYNSATDGQSRLISRLEDEHGVVLATDDRYGVHAGGFIGHCKTASACMDPNSWEKGADGCYYCYERTYDENGNLKRKKNGELYGSNTGYRMRPKRVNGHTRYVVERREKVGEVVDANGKKVKTYAYHAIDEDKTSLNATASDRKAAMKRASLNELKRHTLSGRTATKYSVNGQKRTVKSFSDMGTAERWKTDGDKRTFQATYDENNSHEYICEQGTTGIRCYRMVRSVQTARVFDKNQGTMVTKKIPHVRKEHIKSGCKSYEEAMHECQKHERKSILEQRFDPAVRKSKEFKAVKDFK